MKKIVRQLEAVRFANGFGEPLRQAVDWPEELLKPRRQCCFEGYRHGIGVFASPYTARRLGEHALCEG
jgi:hypothetical protein